MTQLNILESRKARDTGVERAARHSGERWIDQAIEDFVDFVTRHGEATCEAWRFDWLNRGNPEPITHKAWGAVAITAARRGLIINTRRYVQAESEKTHAHAVPIWTPKQS